MKVAYKETIFDSVREAVREAIGSMKTSEISYVTDTVTSFIEDTHATEMPSFQTKADQFAYLVCTANKVLILRIPVACKIKLPVLNVPELDTFADAFFSKGGNAIAIINSAFVAKGYKLATKVAQKMAVRKNEKFPSDFACIPLQNMDGETSIRFSKKDDDKVKANTFIRPMLCVWLDETSTLNPNKDAFVFAGSIEKAVSLIADKAMEVSDFYTSLIISNEYIPTDKENTTSSKKTASLNEVMKFLQGSSFVAPAIYSSSGGYLSWARAFSIGSESYIHAFTPMFNDVESFRKNKKVKLEKPERIEVFTKMCEALGLDSSSVDRETLLYHTTLTFLNEICSKPEVSKFKGVVDYSLPLVKIVDGHGKRISQLLSYCFIRPVSSGKAKAGSRYMQEGLFTSETIAKAASILVKIALYGGAYDPEKGRWSGDDKSEEAESKSDV